MTTKLISFDLDSTLANTEHRWPMIVRDGTMDWEAYSLACVNDAPGPALPLAQFCTLLEIPFIIVSGRSEIARVPTLKWLHDHDVKPWAVFLEDDRHCVGMTHAEWKALRLQELQEAYGWDIVLHIDDIKDVARCTAALGVPTMLVHEMHNEAYADHFG